jgi:glutathione S-transferase
MGLEMTLGGAPWRRDDVEYTPAATLSPHPCPARSAGQGSQSESSMNALQGPALVTLFTAVLHVWLSIFVGQARVRTGINAPATTGDPAFERVFRAQMNTIEATMVFLPALWIAALYGQPIPATGLGAVWILARVWYARAYAREAAARGPAFTVSTFASAALLVAGFVGVVRSFLG